MMFLYLQTAGTIRVPLYILTDGVKGLPMFLTNKFAGHAREQLVTSIRDHQIIPQELMDKALVAYDKLKTVQMAEEM